MSDGIKGPSLVMEDEIKPRFTLGKWVSVDSATKAGVAVWDGLTLVDTLRVYQTGGGALAEFGPWTVMSDFGTKRTVYDTQWEAWSSIFGKNSEALVIETNYLSRNPKTLMVLSDVMGRTIGYAQASGVVLVHKVQA